MEPTQPTIRVLFDSRTVYRIPNYQRAYVWTRESQWEPLWMDVATQVDRLLEVPEDRWGDLSPHFLGAVVLKQQSRPAGSPNAYAVVDGQQRITTTQLLLAAVADAFRERGLGDMEADVRDLTVNRTSGRDDARGMFKIEPLGRDYLSFTKVLRASKDGKQPTDVTDAMGDCYRFFLGEVRSWLGQEEPHLAIAQRARALFTVVSDKLQVVGITLNVGENEYAIFEALNARGEPLSEWEKVKNYILYKAGEVKLDPEEMYAEELQYFDEPVWRGKTGRGSTSRRKSDLFLDYWLESELHRPIDARYIFREFKKEIDQNGGETLTRWCADMKRRGEYFLRWEGKLQFDGGVEPTFHARRNTLGIGAVWPFLFALSRIEMEQQDRDRCFRALDSFMWRRAIVGIDTKGYSEVTEYLLKALPDEPSGELPYSNAVIDKLLDSQGFRRLLWPSDDDMRQAIAERYLYRDMNTGFFRVLIETIERAIMRSNRAGNPTLPGNLPIEHIMPRNRSEADWPTPPDADDNFEQRRGFIIDRLGNLTLVDRGLNSKLGNKPWVEKRRILAEEDNLYINKDLLNHAPSDHWDEEHIRLRGERFVDYVIQIWPHGHAVTGEIEKVRPVPKPRSAE